ncbi:MAG TPA: two-component regulator propeller domain-containing protein [Pyrinomonadaceae bacterium]|nr:two-component regulator propeller domain-containing protein [Pyrinomonadaceae bacterium]
MNRRIRKSKRQNNHTAFVATVSLFLACLIFSSTSAQNTDNSSVQSANLHQWGAVTLFHGLPSDRVRAIAQDGDGAMWFGTDNGLARYDGRRTQSVAIEGFASASRVLALKFDAGGTLWAGTDAGAARLASGGTFRAIEETRGKVVTAILPRDGGGAWLATAQGQIFECSTAGADGRVNARALNSEVLQSADADRPGALELTSLVAGEGGVIYAGTRSRGLLSFDGGEAKEINSRPRAYFVEALERDARDVVWVGARGESGLYESSDPLRPVRTGEGLGTVTALRAGAGGDLWVGTERRGVYRFRGARLVSRFTFEDTAGGLRSDHIYAIHVDREGVVWFGTDRGVCRFDPRSPRNERLATDAESNFVRALYRTKTGELLCGTNRGLFVREAKTGAWRAVAELERQSVYAIAEDAAGRLVVGTSGGLRVSVSLKAMPPKVEVKTSEPSQDETTAASRTQEDASKADAASATQAEGEPPETEASPQPAPSPATKDKKKEREQGNGSGNSGGGFSVRAIRVFQGATYLATYGRGVERLDGERRTLVWPVVPDADAALREVTTLHAEDDRRLWIGTARAGLYVLENGQVKAAGGELDKLKGSTVRAIEGSGARGLWVATTKGLYALDKGRLVEMVSGVEVRAVVAGVEDNSLQAWCATAGGGLLRVSLDERVGRLVSRLDAEQGLSSPNAFALLRLEASGAGGEENEESLLVGTNRGLVSYTPGHLAPSLIPTRILSRRLHPADELRGGLELPYPQDNLTLDVAALSSRTFPEQFQYAFALSDGDGRELKRKLSNDAQFLMENLKPGRYRVEARAFTKDLVASAPLAFEFTVGRAPFPWTTTMLAVLLILALVALTWGTVQNRKIARTGAALRQAHHDLAGARLNLANEAERERRRIARDLHDQTLADLRSLLLLTDQMPANVGSSGGNSDGQREGFDPAVFRTEIESVSDEIRRICEDLSPSVLENVGLAAALEWAISNAVAHLPASQKFEYEFVCDEDLDERTEFQTGVRMQIYRIAQEAINNICRHAAATRVRFTVELTHKGELVLTLEDDGRGFNTHDKRARKGRGLTGIRARAALIEAEVSWHARKPRGTVFTLRKRNAAPVVDARSV